MLSLLKMKKIKMNDICIFKLQSPYTPTIEIKQMTSTFHTPQGAEKIYKPLSC